MVLYGFLGAISKASAMPQLFHLFVHQLIVIILHATS